MTDLKKSKESLTLHALDLCMWNVLYNSMWNRTPSNNNQNLIKTRFFLNISNSNITFNHAFIKFAQRDIDSARFVLEMNKLLVYVLTDVRYAGGYKNKQKRLKNVKLVTILNHIKPESNFDEESLKKNPHFTSITSAHGALIGLNVTFTWFHFLNIIRSH